MKFNKKPSELSQEEIAAWQDKDKYRRKINSATFEDFEGNEVTYFFVLPNRRQSAAIAEKKGILSQNELLVNTCVLAGPMDKLEYDDDLLAELFEAMDEVQASKKKRRIK